jgi:anti-anti-sigma regulatory factor
MRQEEGCSILDIQGDIDTHNFAVLKAGLTKLFQNGKNRIVLNILDGENLASEVIREIAILDVFARELSGKLVIASESTTLKSNVLSFAKPPVVGILPSVAKAVEYLKDLDALEGDEGGESLSEVTAALEAKTRQISALEAQLKQASGADAQGLREENAKLKDRLTLLESQVGDLSARRRQPADAEGFLEKIEALEENVRRLGGEKLQAGAKK